MPDLRSLLWRGAGWGQDGRSLREWLEHAETYKKDAIGIMFRRELVQLQETMERSKVLYTPLKAKWHEQTKTWTMHNGARLRFAYLDKDADADGYQGHSYTRVYVEEIGTFPNRAPINRLMATLRSGQGVPCGFRATGNPGGPGHHHVKQRYIDPAPGGYKIIREPFKDPFSGQTIERERVFIPSKVTDNPSLGGEYIANLQMSGSEQLVRAWLEGDWSVIDGAFFDQWSMSKHVLRPFAIPSEWLRFRSMDWGYATPFSIGWWTLVADHHYAENVYGQKVTIPRGAIIRYREWYGSKNSSNTGLRIEAEEVAEGIRAREKDETVAYGVLDPSAFNRTSGPSYAERMHTRGVTFRRADNTRVAKRGAISGWDAMRARLRGQEDGSAMLYTFDTCREFIRTVPLCQHDRDNPEDMDTDGEDHAADETRYACMSRPWFPNKIDAEEAPTQVEYTIDQFGRAKANMSVWDIIKLKKKRKA
jgi:hypothetical protein